MHKLPTLFVWLVLLMAAAKMPLVRGNACSGHITKLEQSRFSLDIYDGTCYHENIMFSVSLLQFRHPDCDRECWIIEISLENTNPYFREYQP
jgi:hypothetical protein